MRGADTFTESPFTLHRLENFVPLEHPLRSIRQLMEQVQYNLLYRWFIGLAMEEAVWVPTVFTKNRERLLAHDAVIELFNHVLQSADEQGWLSGEHFKRGRHAYPDVGQLRKLCAQGRQRWQPGRRQLQGAKPFKRNARIKHRCGRQAVPKGRGGQRTAFHGSYAEGQPKGFDCERYGDAGRRPRRARSGQGHDF